MKLTGLHFCSIKLLLVCSEEKGCWFVAVYIFGQIWINIWIWLYRFLSTNILVSFEIRETD